MPHVSSLPTPVTVGSYNPVHNYFPKLGLFLDKDENKDQKSKKPLNELIKGVDGKCKGVIYTGGYCVRFLKKGEKREITPDFKKPLNLKEDSEFVADLSEELLENCSMLRLCITLNGANFAASPDGEFLFFHGCSHSICPDGIIIHNPVYLKDIKASNKDLSDGFKADDIGAPHECSKVDYVYLCSHSPFSIKDKDGKETNVCTLSGCYLCKIPLNFEGWITYKSISA